MCSFSMYQWPWRPMLQAVQKRTRGRANHGGTAPRAARREPRSYSAMWRFHRKRHDVLGALWPEQPKVQCSVERYGGSGTYETLPFSSSRASAFGTWNWLA